MFTHRRPADYTIDQLRKSLDANHNFISKQMWELHWTKWRLRIAHIGLVTLSITLAIVIYCWLQGTAPEALAVCTL
ncbi:MAG: hypothetical protein Q7U43_14435 [Methylococcaceae bacterium]|nr:hypothetical protein [Methylococcaceae bacterium]